MPSNELLRYALAAALSAALAWAAASDISSRRIPNAAVLTLMGLYLPWAAIDHGAGVGSALAAAGVAFAVGYAMYLFKVMGAGDVKLFAATALFIGLPGLPLFALATAIAGGVMAIFALAARPRRAALMFWFRGSGDFGRGIPYGVAIAIGGAFVVWGTLTGSFPPELLRPRL